MQQLHLQACIFRHQLLTWIYGCRTILQVHLQLFRILCTWVYSSRTVLQGRRQLHLQLLPVLLLQGSRQLHLTGDRHPLHIHRRRRDACLSIAI